MTTRVFVTGFPRSGNTWLNRILSYLLDAPIGIPGVEETEWKFADEQHGEFEIYKTHWYAHQWTEHLVENPDADDRIVMIHRDPRDMVVSMMHYRNQTSIRNVILSLESDPSDWGLFKQYWYGWQNQAVDCRTTYEKLHSQPIQELEKLYVVLTGDLPVGDKLLKTNYNNRFDRWFSEYPHLMRKGIVGDWRSHFSHDDITLFKERFGQMLIDMGYESDMEWEHDSPTI